MPLPPIQLHNILFMLDNILFIILFISDNILFITCLFLDNILFIITPECKDTYNAP